MTRQPTRHRIVLVCGILSVIFVRLPPHPLAHLRYYVTAQAVNSGAQDVADACGPLTIDDRWEVPNEELKSRNELSLFGPWHVSSQRITHILVGSSTAASHL